jgi:hypothetical protein
MGTITGEYLKRFHGLPLIRCRFQASHVEPRLLRLVFLFDASQSPELATKLFDTDYRGGFPTTLARIATASVGGEFPVQAT